MTATACVHVTSMRMCTPPLNTHANKQPSGFTASNQQLHGGTSTKAINMHHMSLFLAPQMTPFCINGMICVMWCQLNLYYEDVITLLAQRSLQPHEECLMSPLTLQMLFMQGIFLSLPPPKFII